MTDDSSIEVKKLFISLKPVSRQTDGTSMFESMWSSMSSSMQLAKECLENDGDEDLQLNTQNSTIEGLEKFAQTIDSGKLKIIYVYEILITLIVFLF